MPPDEPNNAEQLAAEITARLPALPSVKTDPVRAVRREFSQRIASAPPQQVLGLAPRLLDQQRFVAYELVPLRKPVLIFDQLNPSVTEIHRNSAGRWVLSRRQRKWLPPGGSPV